MPDLFPRIFSREKLAAPGVSRTREEGPWQSPEYGLARGAQTTQPLVRNLSPTQTRRAAGLGGSGKNAITPENV